MNKNPKDVSFVVKGLELLLAFRDPYASWDGPALVLSYFDEMTKAWVPVYAYPMDGYNNKNNTLLKEHHAWILRDFVKKVKDLIWADKIPFEEVEDKPVEEMTDNERYSAFIKRVFYIDENDELAVNETELEKGW